MSKVFSRVAGLRPGRSMFNLSYEKKFTCDMAQLIPVMCDEVVPGDKFIIGNQAVIRFQPLVAPVLHEINMFVHYFLSLTVYCGKTGKLLLLVVFLVMRFLNYHNGTHSYNQWIALGFFGFQLVLILQVLTLLIFHAERITWCIMNIIGMKIFSLKLILIMKLFLIVTG